MCEATTKFQPRFFAAQRDRTGDTSDAGAALRFGDLRAAPRQLVNLTVCSNEPTSSYDPVATDVTDHFFDSGAAAALAADYTQVVFDAFAPTADRERGMAASGFAGGIGFRRREAQGSKDTECQLVVMPLPSADVRDADLRPCRTHDHYRVADVARKAPSLGPRSGLQQASAAGAHTTSNSNNGKRGQKAASFAAGSPSLKAFEHEADRSDRLVREGEYELTVTPTQLLVRVRHLSGLRHALHTVMQMALHQSHIEHRGRKMDRDVAEVLTAASANATGPDGPTAVQAKLDLARGSKAPIALVVPSVWIFDGPAVGWRGLQLDVARHFHDVATVKEVIRGLARRKMNRLQLHLTDDQGWRVESALFPSLHTIGGRRRPSLNGLRQPKHKSSLEYTEPRYYTAADVRDLSDYAATRGVAIVPEVDLPAHASALVLAFQRDAGLREERTFAIRYGKTRNTARHFKPRELPASNGEDDNALSKWIAAETAFDASGLGVNAARAKALHAYIADTLVPALDKLRRRRSAGSIEAEREDHDFRFGAIRKMNDDCRAFEHTTAAALDEGNSAGAPNCMGGSHGILFPDDDTLLLAQAVLAEVAAVFDRSEYVHIGGDQAERIRDDAWQRWTHGAAPDYIRMAQGANSPVNSPDPPTRTGAQLQAQIMDALIVFVRSTLQRRPIVWDDTLMESGERYTVPYGTIVTLWREDSVSWGAVSRRAGGRPGTDAGGLRTAAFGEAQEDAPIARAPVAFVFLGKTRLYLDYMQYVPASSNRGLATQQQMPPPWAKHKAVTFKRTYDARLAIPPQTPEAHEALDYPANVAVTGVQACLWTELVKDAAQLRFQLFPRLYAASDAAWAGQRVGSVDYPGRHDTSDARCFTAEGKPSTGFTTADTCRRLGGQLDWSQFISLALRVPKGAAGKNAAASGNTYTQRAAALLRLLGGGLPDTPETEPLARG